MSETKALTERPSPEPAIATLPSPPDPSGPGRLRAPPRGDGVASFFYRDAHFGADAVKVLPGEYFVHDEDLLVMTTLGSCIAACLWDREARIGGMNHFMLPAGGGASPGASGRYGAHAMELLINAMLRRGAVRGRLEAKVFGGAQLMGGTSTLHIGERNTAFVLDYLQTERIPVVSRDVLGVVPRRVCYLPASGKAMVKRLAGTTDEALLAQERTAAERAARRAANGSVDLF